MVMGWQQKPLIALPFRVAGSQAGIRLTTRIHSLSIAGDGLLRMPVQLAWPPVSISMLTYTVIRKGAAAVSRKDAGVLNRLSIKFFNEWDGPGNRAGW
jgi:hypothetical protein